MVSWWDRADGMGCVWLGTWWCFTFIIKYEPINHDGFWNSHFLREVLSEKGNHEMNFHNSFLNNSNDFWDLIVRVWSDFGCTSWFWNHYLIWFCMNARPSRGGQDGHLNHACVLWLFCSDRLDFQKDNLDDFFISMLSTHLSTLQEWSSWITFITIPRLTKTAQTIKFQCVFVPPYPPWASI